MLVGRRLRSVSTRSFLVFEIVVWLIIIANYLIYHVIYLLKHFSPLFSLHFPFIFTSLFPVFTTINFPIQIFYYPSTSSQSPLNIHSNKNWAFVTLNFMLRYFSLSVFWNLRSRACIQYLTLFLTLTLILTLTLTVH